MASVGKGVGVMRVLVACEFSGVADQWDRLAAKQKKDGHE